MLNRHVAFQPTGPGSQYGRIADEALGQFNFSWSGALATLQVAHQFYTWTRRVENHTRGGATFEYSQDLPGLAAWATQKTGWDHNQYSLSGVLGALDAPGEWFIDTDGPQATLYFWPPTCKQPADGSVSIKNRDLALSANNQVRQLTVDSITFVGATLVANNCITCTMSNLRFEYPTYNPEIPEMNAPGQESKSIATSVHGTNNTIVNFTLSNTNNHGLKVGGRGNNITNCLIDNTDWLGTLEYAPLAVSGLHTTVSRCTVRRFGNAGVVTSIPNQLPHAAGEPQKPPYSMVNRWLEVSHCHIHHAGLIGKDTAALYTGGWASAGLIWRHNWVHDASEKCVRADDQSRNMSVHHNVIFNCGVGSITDVQAARSGIGLVLKGDGHMIYANTIFGANYTELCLPACIEPLKAFRRQYPFDPAQNSKSQVFNSAARNDFGFPCSCHNSSYLHHPGGNQSAILNLPGTDLGLANVSGMDFRPLAGSPLIDAGIVWPPYTDGFTGSRPDIGAYEHNQERWTAGCQELPGC